MSLRLGIATPTLRTWDRRYGLGPSSRTAGGHRRYTETDVARVELMSRLVEQGVSASHAASVARTTAEAGLSDALANPAVPQVASHRTPGRPNTVAVNALVRAAADCDGPTLSRTYAQTFERRGVVDGWVEVIAPAMRLIGDKWFSGELGVESEHLASERLLTELRSRVRSLRTRRGTGTSVLLASAAEDEHSIPLVAVEAALAVERIPSLTLGARTPFEALENTVARFHPTVAFLWASLDRDGDALAPIRDLDVPHVLLGGPGWGDAVPVSDNGPRFELIPDLPTAVRRIGDLTS